MSKCFAYNMRCCQVSSCHDVLYCQGRPFKSFLVKSGNSNCTTLKTAVARCCTLWFCEFAVMMMWSNIGT